MEVTDSDVARYRVLARDLLTPYRRLLHRLVSAGGVRGDDDSIRHCAQVLADSMRNVGIETTILPSGGAPVVLGRYSPAPADQDRPTLLIYGHYDVEPADPREWDHPPFEVTLESGRFYGRGTADDKGPIACHLMALHLLRSAGEEPSANLLFLFEGGGESGSPGLAEFASSHLELLDARAAYSSDGPIRGDAPNIYLGARGLLSLEIAIGASGDDLHAADHSGLVQNPALEISRLVAGLVGDRGECLIPGFYRNVREQDPPAGCGQPGILLRPSCNVSMVSAGEPGTGGSSVVPGSARARIDFRLVPDQDPVRILGLVDGHLGSLEPEARYRVLASVPPSRTDPDRPEVAKLERILKVVSGRDPYIYPLMTGSAPDFIFTRILGIPSLWVPYADRDRRSHSPEESLRVGAAFSGTLISATVFRGLLAAETPS